MTLLLYLDWPLAITYLAPVYVFAQRMGWTPIFATSDIVTAQMAVEMLPGARVTLARPDYDVAVCCDTRSACPERNRIVLFHGLASKGQDFSFHRRGYCRAAAWISPSPYFTALLVQQQGLPKRQIVTGGLSKYDPLSAEAVMQRVPSATPTIAYLPTHNAELSSVPVLAPVLPALRERGMQTHLHAYTALGGDDHHAAHRDTVGVPSVYPMDSTRLLTTADIVIADYGSTVVEALALHKYVIQVVPPTAEAWHRRNATPEQIRDYPEVCLPMAYAHAICTTPEEVLAAIEAYTPDYRRPPFPLVTHIGDWQVSQIVLSVALDLTQGVTAW
jgi:hypothetical protein